MRIRRPELSDAEAMAEVHVRAWQAGYRDGLMPDDYLDSLDVEDRTAMWREALQRPPRPRFERWVAEDESSFLVGHIVVGPESGEPSSERGEVFALNVHPDVWGRGFGGALLEAGVGSLAGFGFESAVLWVHSHNLRAIGFYERRGWRPDGTDKEVEVLGVVVPESRYVLEQLPQ